MFKNIFFVGIAIVVFACGAFAMDVSKVGTTSAKFLGIPIGARATAMGTAFVSIADDATATFWNPGALNKISGTELHFSHSQWFGDLAFDFGTVTYPLGIGGTAGTIGISYTALNMPEERVTTYDDPEGESSGTFDAGSYAIGISYGKNLTDRFSLGGTVKYISEKILNTSANTFAIDIGTIYTTPFSGIRLGVSISNFGPKLQMQGEDLIVQKDIDPSIGGNTESINAMLLTDEFELPLMMRIGLSWDPVKTESNRLTVVADAMHPNDNTESISLGAEYAFLNESFFLRGGYKNLFLRDNEGRVAFGFGIKYRHNRSVIKFDYAFSEFVHLQDVHIFSVGFSL
jgi:hypothetical protein